MTKLDEAVEAAIEALCSDKNVDVFAKDDGEEYIELDCGHSMSVAMKAAIQAAVKALMPEEAPSDSIYVGDAAWNNCRATILKNAGVE